MADDYTKGIPISLKINEKDIEEFKSILKQIEDGQETDINRLKEKSIEKKLYKYIRKSTRLNFFFNRCLSFKNV